MLALESVGFSTLDLQIEIRSKIGDFLLHTTQSNKAIELLQTFCIVYSLWSLVRDVLILNCHQFLITHRRDALTLQTLCLFLAYLVEQ